LLINVSKTFAGTAPGGNGYFWEHNGTNFNVVKRSYVTGEQVDTVVSQSAWNYDRMDGTGSSSIKIDPSNNQIFYMDQEWLGAGSVRMGFIVNGNIYVATSNLIYETTSPTSFVVLSAGTKTLSDTLDRVRITTVNGTDTFDAGTINILYE
jgi:hypothetical protein